MGRGLQGRGRGFDMGSITVPDRSLQRQKKPSVFAVTARVRGFPHPIANQKPIRGLHDSALYRLCTQNRLDKRGNGDLVGLPGLEPGTKAL